MSRNPAGPLHYLCGLVQTVHQSDSSTIIGRITWAPGVDTCTITRLTDNKTATLNVDQLSWVDSNSQPWPWGSNDKDPAYSGTPQVPA